MDDVTGPGLLRPDGNTPVLQEIGFWPRAKE